MLSIFENVLWYGNIGVVLWLCASLLWKGLWRSNLALFSYLSLDLLQQVLGMAFAQRRVIYFFIYTVGQAGKIALAMWVVLELARHTLAAYPALAAFARKVAGVVIAGSALLSAIVLLIFPPQRTRDMGMSYLFSMERTLDLTVLGLLIALALFLGYYPIQVARNAAVYLGGYVSYFTMRALANYVLGVIPSYRDGMSVAMLASSVLCWGVLALWMTRTGEAETVTPGHRWDPEAAAQLQQKVKAMNDSLSRKGPWDRDERPPQDKDRAA